MKIDCSVLGSALTLQEATSQVILAEHRLDFFVIIADLQKF